MSFHIDNTSNQTGNLGCVELVNRFFPGRRRSKTEDTRALPIDLRVYGSEE